jgi:EmrB/QacA subfamily drug resistance transporter
VMEGSPVAEAPAAGGGAPHPAIELSRRARFEVLGAILLALLLGALDQTIVGTALPTIVTDLNGNALYTWVVTIYLLTSTISVPFYGKLSDYFGRKPLLLIGITIFLVGSALSGLSQTMEQLILFRGIQGLGAGALFPISLAVIGDLFTPAERGKYQGLFGAVFGFSALVGPALGGFITDNASWHWIFYINIPIGLISLAVVGRVLPVVRRPHGKLNLDWVGGIVFIAGMIPLLVGLTNKQTADWTDPQVSGLVAAGLALLVVFLFIESHVKEPIVPLDLWRDRTYAGSILATFFASFGFFAAVIFLPRYYQVVLGESATASGYALVPLLIGVIFSSIVSGQIVARTGRYKLLLLVAITLLGIGSYLFTNLAATTASTTIWLWQLALGIGIGPTLAVFTIVVQNAVPFNKLGVATSNLTFFRQTGGVVGLSIAGSLFGTQLANLLPERLVANGIPTQLVDQLGSRGGGGFDLNSLVGVGTDLGAAILAKVPAQAKAIVEPLVPRIVTSIYESISFAIASVFYLGVVAAVIAFVAVLFIRELPLRSSLGPVPARPGPATGADVVIGAAAATATVGPSAATATVGPEATSAPEAATGADVVIGAAAATAPEAAIGTEAATAAASPPDSATGSPA